MNSNFSGPKIHHVSMPTWKIQISPEHLIPPTIIKMLPNMRMLMPIISNILRPIISIILQTIISNLHHHNKIETKIVLKHNYSVPKNHHVYMPTWKIQSYPEQLLPPTITKMLPTVKMLWTIISKTLWPTIFNILRPIIYNLHQNNKIETTIVIYPK